jgi:hypothetical protein
MTTDQLHAAHRAVPFRPFTIRMADGRSFHIPHPDFLWIMPPGRTVAAAHEDGVAHTLDLLLMTEIEFGTAQAATT